MELLPAIVLYAEVLLFVVLERQLWRTLYTPLNCLMIPYAVILALCLAIDGSMGFASFYYPSIWVWVIGLAVFFIPSFCLGMLYSAVTQRKPDNSFSVPKETLSFLERITRMVLVLFALWAGYLTLTSPFTPGSDKFGEIFAGQGIFGHLFTLLMVLSIIWIYLVDKQHKRYWLYIFAFIGIALLYLVKGWLLIPVIGGLLLRLLMKRTRLKPRLILTTVVLGFVFFFASYWLSMFIVRGKSGAAYYGLSRSDYAKSTAMYIQKHFVTYLTAGVYGLSEDMAQGVREERDPSKIYTPIINIAHFLTGKELVESLNDKYIIITRLDNGVNVRSFMGTLYVYLGTGHAIVFVFLFSCLVNMLFFIARQRYNLFALIFSAWLGGLLFMGWFDSYVQTLNFITVPIFIVLLYELCFMFGKRDRNRLFLNFPIGR